MEILNLKGIFKLQAWCAKTGKLLLEYEDTNLIVNNGRNIMVNMIAGDAASNQNVTSIGFGTNGTAPVVSDSGITSQFLKALASHSYPATGAVQFNWTLETTENNGVNISEYGLICGDASLFARKVGSPVISKTSNIRLTGSWTITF